MKDNTLFKQMLQLSQSELESMSITRQGTVTVDVSENRELPDVEIHGADVKIGGRQVVVTKRRKATPYSGNVSQVVHQSQSSFGKSIARVSKDGIVTLNFTGTIKSVRSKYDLICAVVLISKMLDSDNKEIDTEEVSDMVKMQYDRAKELYDREEKHKIKSWETRERNDLMKIKNQN